MHYKKNKFRKSGGSNVSIIQNTISLQNPKNNVQNHSIESNKINTEKLQDIIKGILKLLEECTKNSNEMVDGIRSRFNTLFGTKTRSSTRNEIPKIKSYLYKEKFDKNDWKNIFKLLHNILKAKRFKKCGKDINNEIKKILDNILGNNHSSNQQKIFTKGLLSGNPSNNELISIANGVKHNNVIRMKNKLEKARRNAEEKERRLEIIRKSKLELEKIQGEIDDFLKQIKNEGNLPSEDEESIKKREKIKQQLQNAINSEEKLKKNITSTETQLETASKTQKEIIKSSNQLEKSTIKMEKIKSGVNEMMKKIKNNKGKIYNSFEKIANSKYESKGHRNAAELLLKSAKTSKKTVENNKNQIKNIKKQIEKFLEEIKNIMIGYRKEISDINGLVSEVNEIKERSGKYLVKAKKALTDVSGNKKAIETIKGEFKNTKTEIEGLVGEINVKKTGIDTLVVEINGIKTGIDTLFDEIKKKKILNNMGKNISKMVNMYTFFDNKKKVIEGNLNMIRRKKEELKQKISELERITNETKIMEQLMEQIENNNVQAQQETETAPAPAPETAQATAPAPAPVQAPAPETAPVQAPTTAPAAPAAQSTQEQTAEPTKREKRKAKRAKIEVERAKREAEKKAKRAKKEEIKKIIKLGNYTIAKKKLKIFYKIVDILKIRDDITPTQLYNYILSPTGDTSQYQQNP